MAEELLAKLKNRDRQAQAALRKRLFAKTRAICMKMFENPSIAEEVAEDLWMDFIYQHVDKVKKEQALGAYLRMMTVRRCIRILQWQHRHQELGDQAPLVEGSESSRVENLDHKREFIRLEHCLNRLNQKIRKILRMRYYHEMTQETIGKHLEVSKQYIGRLLAKSLKKLKTCMEETG